MFSDLENLNKIGVYVNYIQFKCKKCNRTWGVVLKGRPLAELPEGWSVCDSCARKEKHKENVIEII